MSGFGGDLAALSMPAGNAGMPLPAVGSFLAAVQRLSLVIVRPGGLRTA